ncbi:MAG: hypothetical protein QF824_01835 [Candidatus Woesearchaeota archaeon]|jgi:hypothetical protein|nr:hypothetical protein [Candidatus Woesearchaeota archaeon]
MNEPRQTTSGDLDSNLGPADQTSDSIANVIRGADIKPHSGKQPLSNPDRSAEEPSRVMIKGVVPADNYVVAFPDELEGYDHANYG